MRQEVRWRHTSERSSRPNMVSADSFLRRMLSPWPGSPLDRRFCDVRSLMAGHGCGICLLSDDCFGSAPGGSFGLARMTAHMGMFAVKGQVYGFMGSSHGHVCSQGAGLR